MDTMIKNKSFYLILSILLFYFCWGIPQFFNKYNLLDPEINNWLFSTLYTGIAGCLIPVMLRNRYRINYVTKATIKNKTIGFLVLGISLVFGLIFSGALVNTIKLGYSFATITKYVLLFFPMSLGISLFAFLLLPGIINKVIKNRLFNIIVTSFLIGIFFFIGFFIDSTFGNIKLGITMGFLGLFFGISNWFTRNFWITFFGFFITILFNTLSEDKYSNYALLIAVTSTTISLLIILIDISRMNKMGQNYA